MLQQANQKNYSINELKYHFLYLLRKAIPKVSLFYLVITILKILSMIDSTQNVSELESKGRGINYIVSKIYVRNLISFNVSIYKWVSLGIIVILLVFICFMVYIKKQLDIIPYSKRTIKRHKKLKKITRLVCYFICFIVCISQHLIEFLYIGVFTTYSSKTIDTSYQIMKEFSTFGNSWEIALICISNCLSIIMIISLCGLFYYFAQSSSFNPITGFNSSFNWIYYTLLMFININQGIMGTLQYNLETERKKISIYICFAITSYNILCVLIWSKSYINSTMDYMLQFMHFFLIISGITEIFLYYLSVTILTEQMIYFKLSIEFLNAFFFMGVILKYKNKRLLQEFSQCVFNENKKAQLSSVLAYIGLLNNCLMTGANLYKLYEIFILHINQCSIPNCVCSKIKTDSLSITIENQKQSMEQFLIVAEQEIISETIKKSKTKHNTKDAQDSILAHLDFIFSMKNSIYLSLYIAQRYLNDRKSNTLSFKTRYFLYEYKKRIIYQLKCVYPHPIRSQFFKDKENNQLISSIMYSMNNELIHYICLIEKIRDKILKACENLVKIFNLQSSELKMLNNSIVNCEHFITFIRDFESNDQLILKELNQNFDSYNKMNNKEMCYLINHYYTLIYKHIPHQVQSLLGRIFNSNASLMKDNIDYDEIQASNPLIISINNEDVFIIKYISQQLCKSIHYKKSELINESIIVLLPKLIGPTHQIYMKHFCLSGVNQIQKKTFFFDKNNRMVPVDIKANIFPNLMGNLSIIINSKIILLKHKEDIKYFFFLDKEFNIMATNEHFEEYFFLNKQVLDLFKVSFCNLFSLNQEQLLEQFKKHIDNRKISKKENMEEMNQAISVMNSCRMQNMFYYRKKKRLEDLASDYHPIHTIIRYITPVTLFNSINKIEKEVEEMGLDTELNTCMMFLKERLRINIEWSNQYNIKNILDITIRLKKMCNLFYFTAEVTETIHSIEKVKENYKAFLDRNIYSNYLGDMINSSIYNTESGYPKTLKSSAALSPSAKSPNQNRRVSVAKRQITMRSSFNNNNSNTINTNQELSANTFESNTQFNLCSVTNLSKKNQIKIIEEKINKELHNDSSSITINKSSLQPIKINKQSVMNKRSKRKICYKYLNHLYWILTILIVMIIISKIIFVQYLIKESKGLFNIFVYASISNGDLSFIALNILSNCLVSDNIHTPYPISTITLLDNNANEMRENFYIVKKYISEMSTHTVAKDIFKTITSPIELMHLYEDFQIKTRQSTIWEEVLYLHYLIDSHIVLMPPTEPCRVKELFYKEQFKTNVDQATVTSKEQMMFYVLYNLTPIIRSKLFEIINLTIQIMLNYNSYMFGILNCETIIAMSLIALFYLTIIGQIILLNTKLKKKMLILFSVQPEELHFEEQLKCFLRIINDFDSESIKKYEEYTTKIDLYKNTLNLSAISLLKPSITLSSSLYQSKKSFGKSNHHNHHSNSDQNNQNIKSNHPNNNVGLINKPNINKKLLQAKIINISFVITIAMFLIIMSIKIANLYISRKYFNLIQMQTKIGFNFIQRLPTIADLTSYYFTTIIVNNEYYIQKDYIHYQQDNLTNHYSFKLNLGQDAFTTLLNETYYSLLYYNFLLQRETIQQFTRSYQGNEVLPTLKTLEDSISNSKDFIAVISFRNASNYYNINIDEEIPLIEAISEISSFAKIAKVIENGVNMNGLNPVLDLMIQEINTNFLAFTTNNKETRNLNDYLSDKDLIYISENVQIMLNAVSNIYSHTIINDMIVTYNTTQTNELWLVIITLIVHLIFATIILLVVLVKLNKIVLLFTKTEKIILNAIAKKPISYIDLINK